MNEKLDVLDRRLMRLESQNRRLKWLGVVCVVLAMATVAWGENAKSVAVQAQSFELRDDGGRLRAELAILNGGPTLRFFDKDEDVQCLLAEDSFTIFKKGGDIQAVFAFNGLSFEDGHDKVFVTLGASENEQMGKLKVSDYRHKIFSSITAEDVSKLHSDNPR
jgi:hypothetical protein